VPTEAQGEVTRLLAEVAAGNEKAKRELFAHVYGELRQMAHRRIEHERAGHTWGSADLVHEAYLRLVKSELVCSKNRTYFFSAAARAMHQLLIKHSAKRRRQPHIDPGGHILLDEVVEAVESTCKVGLIDLMKALHRLRATGKRGERRYDVVRLRLWCGFTWQEIAREQDVGIATVERDWLAARAWLYGQLKAGKTDE
jgi:RNA polymerase sigma factor (TIGR02999 family)